MADLVVTQVAPIGKRTVHGFGHLADGTPIYEWEANVYPPSTDGTALRELRRELDIGLRDAAKRMGISVVQLSALELGSATCDRETAQRLLRGGAR